jgi:hypothetical protein
LRHRTNVLALIAHLELQMETFKLSDPGSPYVIQVDLFGRARVARQVADDVQPCSNWEELEPDARAFLEKAHGPHVAAANYRCPQQFLLRAQWPDGTPSLA